MSNATFLLDPATGQRYRAGGSSDANGNTTVAGSSAAGAADSGAPVKVGGVYNTTLPTLTDGQRGNLQMDSRGGAYVVIKGPDVVGAAAVGTGSDGLAASTIGLTVRGLNQVYNGTSWDRARGDVTAAYSKSPPLAKTASAVTAGSTTSQQLFAASATRSRFIVQNQDAAINVFVNLGAAATAGAGSIRIAPGATLELNGTNEAVNLIAASGTPAITAWQF